MTPALRAALDALGVMPAPPRGLPPPVRNDPPAWRPTPGDTDPPF